MWLFLLQSLGRMQALQKEIAAKNLACPPLFGFVPDTADIKESLLRLQLPLCKDWDVGQPLSPPAQKYTYPEVFIVLVRVFSGIVLVWSSFQ